MLCSQNFAFARALNQLLVIDPTVGQPVNTEIYLHYYDIMVRNAFGNYKDILREVVYSPMMSETLTYYQSKSTDYVWERKKQHQYPDENFARELFQLFTIGLVEINADGTYRLDEEGKTIRTYSNADIMEYARAWTGFDRQNPRGNVEERSDFANSIDPMTIQINWRDHLPKLVQEKYIGDGYGLCSDLPPRHFLMKGAKFRIMSMKEVQNLDSLIPQNVEDMKVLELTSSSELAETLCQRKSDSSGVCSYPGTIELQRNLRCWGDECMVSNARIVRLGDVYYEHIRPPCVYLSFFNNGKFVSKRRSLSGRKEERMCVDPDTANFEGDFWDSSSDCEVFIIVDKKGRVAMERNEIYKQCTFRTILRVSLYLPLYEHSLTFCCNFYSTQISLIRFSECYGMASFRQQSRMNVVSVRVKGLGSTADVLYQSKLSGHTTPCLREKKSSLTSISEGIRRQSIMILKRH